MHPARLLYRQVSLTLALLLASLTTANAHEIRPTIADVTIGSNEVTLELRITLESILAGIDVDTVQDTNDAPEAELYDVMRALDPAALEAALRADWGRIAPGFVIEVEGTRLLADIVAVEVPEAGNVELPRDSFLTIRAALPEGNAPVRLGLAEGYGTFVPRQTGGGEDAYEGFLAAGALTPALARPMPEGWTAGDLILPALLLFAALGAGLLLRRMRR